LWHIYRVSLEGWLLFLVHSVWFFYNGIVMLFYSSRAAIDYIRNGEIFPQVFNIVNGVGAEQVFYDACDQIYHGVVSFPLEHYDQFVEDPERLVINGKRRASANGGTLRLYEEPEFGRKLEYGMLEDKGRYILLPLFLITNMDQTMIDSHFELCWRLIFSSLVFVKLLQTLKSCEHDYYQQGSSSGKSTHCTSAAVPPD
jgi:hypothetical protein